MRTAGGVTAGEAGSAADAGATRRRGGMAAAVAVCASLAVASLVLPATLAYDPWAWLVWGREVAHLDLDTTGGPSWKPLPVVLTTALAPTGDLAIVLWLVVARTAGLLAVAATYRLAARFAGPLAGVVAAALLLLTPDGGPRFLRLVVEGHTAPLTAALGLWAVDRHLAGRHAQAFVLVVGFSLDRPEAWPFLAAYAVWLWSRSPQYRALVAAGVAVVPLLWFGGDLWGAGDPWNGAGAAQVESGGIGERAGLVWERTAKAVVAPAWVLAAVGAASAWRRRERAALVVGACAIAWIVLVGAMSLTFGYAALSRFFLPAAAGLCVLAGVGAARIVDAAPPGRCRVACAVALVAASLPFVVVRASSGAVVADGVAHRAELEADLDEVTEAAGGREAVLGCGAIAVSRSELPRVALAWKLDVPLHRIDRRLGDQDGVVYVRAGRSQDEALASSTRPDVEELARAGEWAVYAVGCGAGAAG